MVNDRVTHPFSENRRVTPKCNLTCKFGDCICPNQLYKINLLLLSMKSLLGKNWQKEMGILPQGWDTLQKRQRKNRQPVFIYTKPSVCSGSLHFHQARCCSWSQFILSDPEVHLLPKHIGLSSCKTCQNWRLQDRLLYSSRLSNLSFPFIADNASNTAHTVPILPYLLPTGSHRFFKPTMLHLTSLELTRAKL